MAPPRIQRGADRSKRACQYYFKKLDGTTKWQCKKCANAKEKNGGWTNLLNHARRCVGPTYMAEFDKASKKSASVSAAIMEEYLVPVSEEEKQMSQWIDLLVMKNLPLSFVDCPYVREMSRYKSVSSKTIRKHMLALIDLVRETIKQKLPSKFVLMFDGWTEGTDHYIGLSASYNVLCEESGKEIPCQSLLSMRPLLADGIDG